jgi:nitroreductase
MKSDLFKTIVGKRDRRVYDADVKVDRSVLDEILQAGRMAGSSKNEQPIRSIVLTDPVLKADIANCADYGLHVPESPVVIVLVRAPGSRPFDAGRVAQNMMLAAKARGLDSCPVGIQHDDCARSLLKFPEDWVVAMAVTFGYPTGDADTLARTGDSRISIGSWVKWNTWSED